MQKNIFSFEIPGHSTRREWAVYIIVAENDSQTNYLYVGKVGDNRAGCNPIISRIGNHFSHNPIHATLRNSIEETTEYNYQCYYAVFGVYDEMKHKEGREMINELERRLNEIVQSKFKLHPNYELKNKYIGKGYLSQIEKNKRSSVVTADEEEVLRNDDKIKSTI